MKNSILFVLALILSSAFAKAQDNGEQLDNMISEKRHEIRIDAGSALIIPAIDLQYEYILGRYSGLGGQIFINLEDDSELNYETLENFSVTTFYRQYFFSKEDYGAKGFFAEGFLKLQSGKEYDNFIDDRGSENNDWTDLAMGFGIGWKWVSNNGFVIELNGRLGRTLGIDTYSPDFVFGGGINFGYRF